MDIQGLKDKILQLAIQGKLVEQDKNDEPASVLLQRIKEERDKLVREGKIRKPKKLAPIEEGEKPFDVPDGWEWVRLGEVVSVKSSKRIFAKEYEPYGIPFFRSKEIGELGSGKETTSGLYISIDRYKEIKENYGVPAKGDILLTSVGTIGNTWIVDEREFYYKDGNITQLEKNEWIYNCYIEYFIKSIYFIETTNKTVAGTAYNALTIEKINNVIIPLPPFAEQKRIVEKVDELFALIDELDSNKEDLLEVINLTRNQVLQEAIQGKLVEQNPEDEPASVLLERIKEEREKLVKEGKIKKQKPLPEITEEEKPFEISESWEWVRLGDITRICLGLTHRPEYVERGIPFLSVKDISSGSISFSNCRFIEVSKYNSLPEGSKPQKGDVLFGRVGTLGVPSIVDVDFPFGIFVSLGFLRPYIINMNIYLKTFMETKLFFDQVYSNVFGSAQINLNTGWLSNFLVPLPPLAEQKRIVEKVDEIMNMLDELENKIVINI